MSFVPLVLFVLAFWASIFLVVFKAQGASMADFLWGPLDPMPPDLGTWSEPVLDEARGQLRQERWLSPSAAHTPRYLCHQVRYCDRATGDIVQVVEARIKRQRRRRAN